MVGKAAASLLLSIAMIGAPGHARGTDLSEADLQTGFVFNFLKFTEFPARVGSTVELCVIGSSAVQASFGALDGQEAGYLRVAIVPLAGFDERAACDALFVDGQLSQLDGGALNDMSSRGILTVGTDRLFLERGGLIRLYVERGRLRFEIHAARAKAVGLRLSSKLLSLARIYGAHR